jgi:hypothetical protein
VAQHPIFANVIKDLGVEFEGQDEFLFPSQWDIEAMATEEGIYFVTEECQEEFMEVEQHGFSMQHLEEGGAQGAEKFLIHAALQGAVKFAVGSGKDRRTWLGWGCSSCDVCHKVSLNKGCDLCNMVVCASCFRTHMKPKSAKRPKTL